MSVEQTQSTFAANTLMYPERLLDVKELKKYFPIRKGFFKSVVGQVRSVDGVTFHLNQGETLGLVGESGCGKTTLIRSILMLNQPDAGEIKVEGQKAFSSFKYKVPSDPSSCAFFIVLTLLSKNSELKIKNVNVNDSRIGYIKILNFGANY